jgi:gliding motility-associated-like protein
MEQIIIRIYNRWGELVFGTYVVDDAWDGTFKGEPAEAGVYGYVLEVKCTGGETYTAKGDITLMR